jgi:hypothetical protein
MGDGARFPAEPIGEDSAETHAQGLMPRARRQLRHNARQLLAPPICFHGI